MEEVGLTDFLDLIRKEAWCAVKKLWSVNVCVHDFDDMVNEGVIEFLHVLTRYDRQKSKLSTILTISLRNHYANIVKYETRRVMDEFIEETHSELVDASSGVLFHQLDSKLSDSARVILRCILELDSKFVLWLEKRQWAQKHLNLRYRKKQMKLLLDEYFGRDVSPEFQEIQDCLLCSS